MIKILYFVYVWCSVTCLGSHIGRVMTVSRLRSPTAFRPGVSLARPWAHPPQRIAPAASHRAPYVLYRSPSGHRYVRPYMPTGNRGGYHTSWRTTGRVPSITSASTPEYEFVRAASVSPIILHSDGRTGAIHTIPAPNLSLSEKPIVVMDAGDEIISAHTAFKTNALKQAYQVTEKLPDGHSIQIGKNVLESPALLGMSKATRLNPWTEPRDDRILSLTNPEFTALVKNGAALQLAAEYGLPAVAVPQGTLYPQQFTVQGYNSVLHDPLHTAADTSILPQNLIFQPDQLFLHKLQNQLYQRYPGMEFVPIQGETLQQPYTNQVFVINTDDTPKTPVIDHKNVVRETQGNTIVTLVPQTLVVKNVTEKPVPVEVKVVTEPQNVTLAVLADETEAPTSTVKYFIETTTNDQKSTPIYYAQVGQSVGNTVANEIFAAVNEVRAAADLVQVEKSQQESKVEGNLTTTTTTTTTTMDPDLKAYFVETPISDVKNQTVTELKPLLGVPFSKIEPVTYTLLRNDDTKTKVNKDGAVYAGQIVEASISEDQDFNKEKVTKHARHPPLRLFKVTENRETTSTTPKLTVVKAKIPPKSKLTFDDKTGEPVLRIYASYVNSPQQKEIRASKLSNIKHMKEVVARKQDNLDKWKLGTIKNLDKPQSGPGVNQVTEFGLKLRSRMDEFPSIFEDYDE